MKNFSRSDCYAVAWASANLALCWFVVDSRPFPWIAMVGFSVSPLILIFMAEQIAQRMRRGLIERFASDWNKPQSSVPVALLGWVLLAVQTLFLLFQL